MMGGWVTTASSERLCYLVAGGSVCFLPLCGAFSSRVNDHELYVLREQPRRGEAVSQFIYLSRLPGGSEARSRPVFEIRMIHYSPIYQ